MEHLGPNARIFLDRGIREVDLYPLVSVASKRSGSCSRWHRNPVMVNTKSITSNSGVVVIVLVEVDVSDDCLSFRNAPKRGTDGRVELLDAPRGLDHYGTIRRCMTGD